MKAQNAHRIRKQKDKILPSGGSPNDFDKRPDRYGGTPCLVKVDMDIVDELLARSTEGARLMRYVDEEYEVIAEDLYERIGRPKITLQTAWAVFESMIAAM